MSFHGGTAFVPSEVLAYWPEAEVAAAPVLPSLTITFEFERRPRVRVTARSEREFLALQDWILSHGIEGMVEHVLRVAERERRWRP